jgi:hypothetical protein
MIETVDIAPNPPNHWTCWRVAATIALVALTAVWLAAAYFVWAVTVLILELSDGRMAPGDREFVLWAPASMLFVAPIVIAFAWFAVLRWQRPGWRAVACSFIIGCVASGASLVTIAGL